MTRTTRIFNLEICINVSISFSFTLLSVAATPTQNRLGAIVDAGSKPSRTEPVPYANFGLGADSSRLRVPNMGKDTGDAYLHYFTK